ncbi:helix-turn-helix domain-containing protein [Spirosoma sp. BT702]|uniref:Helix-turn-helix domain-containing protein n=1 Tax=Spirosoma profusum TaxID=2771354 RepID=A0A927AMR7_9BACT|nr:helix-turn-helix domain-containing protein [Spirosoma profusum]MBD2700349.1 helix-turn-helix domain-containing protein [Spirosoma profusum]
MIAPVNEKLELAHQFVLHTNRNIFLTGKAGTGKTTFLHQVKQISAKRLAVVAPTGVAAINAGGVTIHSLFQLPFGPLVPGSTLRESRKFNKEKIRLLRTLDLLIIDEISMVRADVLDGIDEVLRRYRNNGQPFGGVQLLLIGDMQQLPPVIRDEEWSLLKPHYETGYFFGSKALRQIPYISIELTHIYRQADARFISLLNSIREKTVTRDQLADLNQRHIPNFAPHDKEGYITLSTHNTTAQQINSNKLAGLPTGLHTFEAIVEGDFPTSIYPTEASLELKVGAQVMFIKNDITREKRYYNGKIGQIVDIDDDIIYVQCGDNEDVIDVLPVDWTNLKYTLDPATKEIKAEAIGTFRQFPLKLAWAITIHKSQGLTFEKAIIDASAAFAHGQVYVALSRCKTLDGLVLRSPIPSHSIKTEQTLEDFHDEVQQQTPTEQHLRDSRRSNQQVLLQELFSFERASSLTYRCRRVVNEHTNSLDAECFPILTELRDLLQNKARNVTNRFQQQLPVYFEEETLPEENDTLQERIRKATAYFQAVLGDELLPLLHRCPTDSDNKQVRESLLEVLDELEKELFVKLRSFESCRDGFDALSYLKARNHAELDFQPERKKLEKEAATTTDSPGRGGLYGALMKWRNDLAGEHDTSGYMVLPQKTIAELAKLRPTTLDELLAIKGFGKTKVKQIGQDVLAVIKDFLERPKPTKETKEKKVKEPKEAKIPSTTQTLALFQAGKTIAEIATERGFAVSTIEGHLAQCIGQGELSVEAVLPPERIKLIRSHLETAPSTTFTELIQTIGNGVTYSEIRFVNSAIRAELGEAE